MGMCMPHITPPPCPAPTVGVVSLLTCGFALIGHVDRVLPPVLLAKRHCLFLGVEEERGAAHVFQGVGSRRPAYELVLPPGKQRSGAHGSQQKGSHPPSPGSRAGAIARCILHGTAITYFWVVSNAILHCGAVVDSDFVLPMPCCDGDRALTKIRACMQ